MKEVRKTSYVELAHKMADYRLLQDELETARRMVKAKQSEMESFANKVAEIEERMSSMRKQVSAMARDLEDP